MSSPAAGLRSEEPLPLTVQELTPEWFTKILGHKVKAASVVEAMHGTASKLIVELTYEDGAGADAPKRVCVKGGFNPDLLKLHPSLFAVYQLEAEFYHYIAPQSGLRVPKSYFNGVNPTSGQGIIVLEDLSASKNTFGDPLEAWPVQRVRAGVEQLALLHARTWGKKPEDYPYLSTAFSLRDVITSMMSEPAWDSRFKGDARPPVPEHQADRKRIVGAFKTLWSTGDERLACLLHGDSHIGNTFITASDEPGFLDWQGVHFGSAIHDVAYFITGCLTVDDRRANEVELYQHYLDELHKAGGPKFTREEVWDEYRKQQLHGFAWTFTPPIMQTRERVDTMSVRHCTAIDDHKSLEFLEAMPEYVKE